MTYRIVGDKAVICKDGVYFSVTVSQLEQMMALLAEIKENFDGQVKR